MRLALVAVTALAALAPAAMALDGGISAAVKQTLISKNSTGSASNGVADDPVISHDKRTARALAYVSSATNITSRPTGGFRNVYLAVRKRPYDANARKNWRIGSVTLASTGGAAPNGDSFAPALSGDGNHGAKCLAFVSEASNLVSGDNNGKADVFLRRSLSSSRLTRIETSGAATDVSLDGDCENLAYTSSAGVYVKRIGGAQRKIDDGASDNVTISVYGTDVSWERSGGVYVWRGGGASKVSVGSDPSLSGSGKVVAYERGSSVYVKKLGGGGTRKLGSGKDPSLTLVGTFAYWATNSRIDNDKLKRVIAKCPSGPSSPHTSAHGNYVVYLCDKTSNGVADPQVFLAYVGPK